MTDPCSLGHQPGVDLSSADISPAQTAQTNSDSPELCLTEPVPPTSLSFREIYDQHFAFVYRANRRFGVHEASLDDATQDVFLVVHRKLSTFEGRSAIKTWLYGITRRVAKDYRRRVSRKEKGRVVDEGLESTGQQADESAARKEAAKTLEYILSKLEPDRREVFVLAEMEEMTVPQIAKTLSVNLNTIYSRLRKARQEFEAAVTRHLKHVEAKQ